MVDNYANYFCQRLLSSCSPPQRISFLTQIRGNIVPISMDKKGTHTIQSLLDVMTMDEEEEILANDIKGHVYEMAMVRRYATIYRTSRAPTWCRRPC
jgi:hypothetical protein